ncbi:MAG: patatin-like phospholipase family protein [Brasilonema angustatum HA4187-MV1]|jgi:patatin-like phospholipase/acyl hydrolase|nr:patatin-like phospholipase family protein [Brasilonema angustatum HA4187-MV1]
MTEAQTDHFHILSLDGGGSLGVYTLGVLEKVEELLGEPLYKKFQLIYGTSTGSIIGSLLARGESVSEISKKYFQYIPDIMSHRSSSKRSQALKKCANEVFQDYEFNDENFKTLIGVVATNYEYRRPMIFKSSRSLFQGGNGEPGFGCKIADVVVASCSASPFFDIHKISTTIAGKPEMPEMIDGGFVANNPTLFAITDAIKALKTPETKIKVLSLGVGSYPRSDTNLKETILRKFNS